MLPHLFYELKEEEYASFFGAFFRFKTAKKYRFFPHVKRCLLPERVKTPLIALHSIYFWMAGLLHCFPKGLLHPRKPQRKTNAKPQTKTKRKTNTRHVRILEMWGPRFFQILALAWTNVKHVCGMFKIPEVQEKNVFGLLVCALNFCLLSEWLQKIICTLFFYFSYPGECPAVFFSPAVKKYLNAFNTLAARVWIVSFFVWSC